MSRKDLKPGMAFRSVYVEGDIFLFVFASSMIEGEGLYQRFNRAGGFIENDWYRFHEHASHLQGAED